MDEKMPPASLLYSGTVFLHFQERGGRLLCQVETLNLCPKIPVFLLNRQRKSWNWLTRKPRQGKGDLAWRERRRNSQVLDFIFTVNIQCKNCCLDFRAFVGFKAPSLPLPAAHRCSLERLKTTFRPDVISNSWDIKTLKNGVYNGNADRLLTIAALL